MRDPLDELLDKLRALRDLAASIAESTREPAPTDATPATPPVRVRMVTTADFHPTPRRLQ